MHNTLPLIAGYNSLLVTSLMLHIAFAASKLTMSLLCLNHPSKRSYTGYLELLFVHLYIEIGKYKKKTRYFGHKLT